ncbi:phosphatase PAP2 family protein [Flavobacterium psychrophilum]|nr:phosphatase PAP2 family protein [Flavobacterium psychrophilum]
MKNITFILLLVLTSAIYAQDTIKTSPNHVKEKLKLKQLILPTTLIAVGGILKINHIQNNIRQGIRNAFGHDFHTSADDYLQFVPLAQMFATKAIGLKSKHGYKQMITNSIISNLTVGGVVFLGKTFTKDMRPDGSANNSHPSGHTATAFNNATLLFLEYKDSNIWYASSGYLFATSTAILRVANNKHWSGDVVAGAGVGIAVATIINCWNPFNFDNKNKDLSLISYPIINNENYGLGLIYQIK